MVPRMTGETQDSPYASRQLSLSARGAMWRLAVATSLCMRSFVFRLSRLSPRSEVRSFGVVSPLDCRSRSARITSSPISTGLGFDLGLFDFLSLDELLSLLRLLLSSLVRFAFGSAPVDLRNGGEAAKEPTCDCVGVRSLSVVGDGAEAGGADEDGGGKSSTLSIDCADRAGTGGGGLARVRFEGPGASPPDDDDDEGEGEMRG